MMFQNTSGQFLTIPGKLRFMFRFVDLSLVTWPMKLTSLCTIHKYESFSLYSSAHKNFKHDNGNGDGKASRTNLLWDLILTGKSSSHKGRSSSRHLHMTQQKQRHQDYATQKQLYEGSKNSYNNNLEVQTVPLDVGK